MTLEYMTGAWSTEAPLSADEVEQDRPILEQIVMPEGVTLRDATIYLHGREYTYHAMPLLRAGRQ